MDQEKVGRIIRTFRKDKGMTQLELSELLGVTDRAVSKWERGLGCPDVSFLPKLSEIFSIDIRSILEGEMEENAMRSGNMKKTKFYVCPICGNVIHSMGEIAICCHGIQLIPEEAECPDDNHKINIERIEDEYYVHIEHEMTKSHCISFVAALSSDGLQMTKLYPEGQAENRFKIIGTRRIYYFCNRDGLFYVDI